MGAIIIRPLIWTGPRTPRPKPSQFRTGYTRSLALLDGEIRQLGGSEVVLELEVTDADIGLDGQLRAGAKPRTAAAKISFNTAKQGRLEFATDAYSTWQANVHAVALALEALRAVNRYGVTQQQQQYTGFKALPSAATAPTTRAQARELIIQASGLPDDSRDITEHYRAAAKRFHPDTGGDPEAFKQLEAARRLLSSELTK